jgi:hypothetical protein
MKYARIDTLLTIVNFCVLQWFTLRLFACVEGDDEVTTVGLFANVVPLTGWDFTWPQRNVFGTTSKLIWAWAL